MSAKCPKCEGALRRVVVESITLDQDETSLKGATYSCPHCGTCLNVSIDPLALKTEIVEATALAVLQKQSSR
jgi:hypothetical protein